MAFSSASNFVRIFQMQAETGTIKPVQGRQPDRECAGPTLDQKAIVLSIRAMDERWITIWFFFFAVFIDIVS